MPQLFTLPDKANVPQNVLDTRQAVGAIGAVEAGKAFDIDERRLHHRHACAGSAEVFVIGKGLRFQATVTDLSEGGCYIQTPHQLERGTHLELTFEINKMHVRLSGGIRVVRPRSGIGIAFDNMNDRRRLLMRELIDDLTAQEERSRRQQAGAPSGANSLAESGLAKNIRL